MNKLDNPTDGQLAERIIGANAARASECESDMIGCFNYRDLINAHGYEINVYVSERDYQGDSIAFVYKDNKDGRGYGWLTFGWGSCSGCDALQACDEDLICLARLSRDLVNGIIWHSDAYLAANAVVEHDWEASFIDKKLADEFIGKVKDLDIVFHHAKNIHKVTGPRGKS